MADWRPEHFRAGGKLARRLFDTLKVGMADPPGVTRKAHGSGEKFAYDLMIREGKALGAEHAYDAAGNLFLRLPGRDRSKVIQIGSHLDSVPCGGNYDGAAGVIAGVATIAERTNGLDPSPMPRSLRCQNR